MFNLLKKLKYKIIYYREKKYEKETEDSMKLIWGLKSFYDLTPQDCSIWSMNDIDLIYHTKEQYYTVSIETMYFFDNADDEIKYLRALLDKFTKWMLENNYDINHDSVWLYNIFTAGLNINTHFETIPEAYSGFKFLVESYCEQKLKNKGKIRV